MSKTNDINSTRTKCKVVTRVMGFLQSVERFNVGKRSEYVSRLEFDKFGDERIRC